jgi:hypothetical protein
MMILLSTWKLVTDPLPCRSWGANAAVTSQVATPAHPNVFDHRLNVGRQPLPRRNMRHQIKT